MNHKTARAFERLATLGIGESAVDIAHAEVARTARPGADDISQPEPAIDALREEILDVPPRAEQLVGFSGVPRVSTPT